MTTCPSCQASMPDEANFCGRCGNDLNTQLEGGASPKGGIATARTTYPNRSWQAESDDVQRVTFTRRYFGDVLLEGALLVVTLMIGWFIWLYFTAKTSQTPAKRLLNVFILDIGTGKPISAGRVWVREVLVKLLLFSVVSNVTFYIFTIVNHAWVLFDRDRQALHDKIVNTIVVYAPNGLPDNFAAAQLEP